MASDTKSAPECGARHPLRNLECERDAGHDEDHRAISGEGGGFSIVFWTIERPSGVSQASEAVCEHCDLPVGDDDNIADGELYEFLHLKCLDQILAADQIENHRNVEAQEETCSALWDFAKSLGVQPTADQIGPALERIVKAFGFNMTEIQ